MSGSGRSLLYADTGYHSEVASVELGSARSDLSAHSNLSAGCENVYVSQDLDKTYYIKYLSG